jgi:steroid delta-isomerase
VTDPEAIRSTIEDYCRTFGADREAWVALFADDATVEDPVGSELRRGREAIATFWDETHALADRIELVLSDYVKVVGNEGVFAMDVRMGTGGDVNGMAIIDLMTFDDDARITSLRAFWDFSDLRPLP